MKKIIPILVVLLAAILTSSRAQDIWIQKSDVGYNASNVPAPTARHGAVGFSIGNKGYIGTGHDGVYKKDFWEYDPDADTWTQKADFGGSVRTEAVGFSIGSKGYIGTGTYHNEGTYYHGDDDEYYYYKDFWEYDPNANTWTPKANFGGHSRGSATGFSIGSKGYLGIGTYFDFEDYNYEYYADFWEYDPNTDSWTVKADFGGGVRYNAAGFSIGDNGYIGTGETIDSSRKDFWEYNSNADTWTEKADFAGSSRADAVGISISGKGYIGTGSTETDIYPWVDYYSDFWEYDPAVNSWSQKAGYGGGEREHAVGFSIGSKGYIGTGNYHKDFWEYSPDFNAWSPKADFGSITQSAASFSIDIRGYIVSGKDLWEFFPYANTWTQKADFGGTARSSAIAFSIDSKGYVGTGYDGAYKKDFWEYDPYSNVWIQKADFGGDARINAVGFSIGNKGYLGTGYSTIGSKKDFWEYDPYFDSWVQKTDFGGSARFEAIGFSIGDKGYLGIGSYDDFWEYDPDANSWTEKANFPGETRASALGFSIGCKGYMGTGYGNFGWYFEPFYYNDFWEFEPGANTWTQKSSFEGNPRAGATGFSIAGKGYIGLGYFTDGVASENSYYYKDFWEYTPEGNGMAVFADTDNDGYGDPADSSFIAECIAPIGFANNNSDCDDTDAAINPGAQEETNGIDDNCNGIIDDLWTKKADFGGGTRSDAIGFSIGDKAYIGTGTYFNNGTYVKEDFWEYDPGANTWTQKANFGGDDRYNAVGFSINNKGYLGTGYEYPNFYKDFWEYDPGANTWTKKADFGGAARSQAVGFSIGNKGYLGTGVKNSTYYKDFWEYDPDTNTWTQKSDFGGTARWGAVGFSIADKAYLGTGNDGNPIKDFWQFNPDANTWSKKADFGGSARYDASGFSIGGKGYIGTGYSSPTYYTDFWEYDSYANTWTQKPDFSGNSRSAAVGLCVGSKGYIGTGYVSGFGQTNDFWEYTPDTGVAKCNAPATFLTVNINATNAKLKWLGINDALSYKIRYKATGTSEWTVTKSTENHKNLNGLAASTKYTWQVKSFCEIKPVASSDWSEKQFFTTKELRLSDQAVDEMTFNVYPNPVSSSATISFSLNETSPVIIEIMDVNGRSLKVIVQREFPAGSNEVIFNRESLVAGIYFLQLKSSEGLMMKKLVIE